MALTDDRNFFEAVEVRVRLLQSLAIDVGRPGESAKLAGAAIADRYGSDRAVLELGAALVELLNAWEAADSSAVRELLYASSKPRRLGFLGGLNTACLCVLGIQAERLGTTVEALLQMLGERFA